MLNLLLGLGRPDDLRLLLRSMAFPPRTIPESYLWSAVETAKEAQRGSGDDGGERSSRSCEDASR